MNDNYGKKDIYCNISNYENNYKLVCTPKHKIDNATLNNAIGIGSSQNVLIHMRNENETLQFNPDGNPISNYYQKKDQVVNYQVVLLLLLLFAVSLS